MLVPPLASGRIGCAQSGCAPLDDELTCALLPVGARDLIRVDLKVCFVNRSNPARQARQREGQGGIRECRAMSWRLVEAGIVKYHTAIRFEDGSANERCTARIAGTDLILGDDVSTLLEACADTRDGEIWSVDADMHHDDSETRSSRLLDEFKLGRMREDSLGREISVLREKVSRRKEAILAASYDAAGDGSRSSSRWMMSALTNGPAKLGAMRVS